MMTRPILHEPNLPIRRSENENAASLYAWNPWQQLGAMNRWFDDFMGRSFGVSPFDAGTGKSAPAIDLFETKDELVLFAFLPGAKRDAFDVEVSDDTITIRGERQALIEGEDLRAYGSGAARLQGRFESSYRLPHEVNGESVQANYHDGVLEIRLPKAERAKPRSIKVNVAEK